MNDEPTISFALPPCPVCSTVLALERPIWRLARHHFRVTREKKYALLGCVHAGDIGGLEIRDMQGCEVIEEQWRRFCELAFEEKTANWTAEARRRFREILDDKPRIAGLTELIDFTAATADQPKHEERKTNASNEG